MFVAIRLPSLFEPPWSADEGAYADVGVALDHGRVLYVGVWDNKPPGIYWLAAAVNLGGASALHMQLLLFGVVGIGALVVFQLGRRLAGTRTALFAGVLYVAFSGLPPFSGDQLNTEAIAAVPAAAAMLVALRGAREPPSLRRFLVAGALVAVAFLVDVRTAADLFAVACAPALVGLARGRLGFDHLRAAGAVVAGFALALGVVVIPLALGGSLGGLVDTLVSKDSGYLTYFQSPARFGSGASPAGAAAIAAGAARVGAALVIGIAVAVAAARRRHSARAAVVSLWLGCDTAAVLLDARSFTHYVELMGPSLALALALGAGTLARRTSLPRLAAACGTALLLWPIALVVLWIPLFTASVATGAGIPGLRDPEAAGLVSYFSVGWQRVVGAVSQRTFDDTFDSDLYPLNAQIAAILRTHSAANDSVYVWGGKGPWTYSLAGRAPSARFIWMGSAYGLYPGAQAVAVSDLERDPPAVVVDSDAPPAEVVQFLDAHGYEHVAGRAVRVDYWIAPSAPR